MSNASTTTREKAWQQFLVERYGSVSLGYIGPGIREAFNFAWGAAAPPPARQTPRLPPETPTADYRYPPEMVIANLRESAAVLKQQLEESSAACDAALRRVAALEAALRRVQSATWQECFFGFRFYKVQLFDEDRRAIDDALAADAAGTGGESK